MVQITFESHKWTNVYYFSKCVQRYNYCKFYYFHCDMGVKQGETVYPFMFATFLSDLQMFFEDANLNGLETV